MEELRRLAGWPDLSPLQELSSVAFERWIVSQVSAGIRGLRESGQMPAGPVDPRTGSARERPEPAG